MLISFSPIRIYLFSDKLPLILRSQLRMSSSKKPWSPRHGHCGGMGNKNGPISNSTLGPHGYHNKQTRKQTDHQTNKQEGFLCDIGLAKQGRGSWWEGSEKGWGKQRVYLSSIMETSLLKNMPQCLGWLGKSLSAMPKATVEMPIPLAASPAQ